MRHVTSDLPRWQEMVWSYGPKPPLQAAAALRPDGRYALAVVNDTPGITAARTSWDPPTDYRVTFAVPELAGAGERDLRPLPHQRRGPGAMRRDRRARGRPVTIRARRASS